MLSKHQDQQWRGVPQGGHAILDTIRATRAAGRMALCGYFLVGYPTPADFYRMVRAARALDIVEFGIPADDPRLDGPIIASAHETVTRERGVNAETALVLIGGLRGLPQPRFVMTYTAVGRALGGFLRLCVQNDVHGILVPDIAPEEGAYVATVSRAVQLTVVTLLDARADDAAFQRAVTTGDVVYLKAAPGPSGDAADFGGELHDTLARAIDRLRTLAPSLPVAIGIGIRQPEQVAAMARLDADMVIVGTRIIEHLETGEDALVRYINALRDATAYP